MVPVVPTVGSELGSWLLLAALVFGPGVVATVLWSGVLASRRLRSLFGHLPLTGSTVGNYVLVAMGLSLPWIAGLGWAFSEIASRPGAEGEPLLTVAVLLAVLYVAALPPIAGLALPRLGIDWAERYGPGTWLLLLVASAWYGVIFAVPTVLAGVVYSLPF